MDRSSHDWRSQGFALVELMIVVAILAVLLLIATTSYRHFISRAKAVEGEVAIREVERLQYLYHAAHHNYTDNLAELGFSASGLSRYYSPELRLGSDSTGVRFQVRAVPIGQTSMEAWLLTSYRSGAVTVDKSALSELGPFASVRYAGHNAPMTASEASVLYQNGGFAAGDEPQWLSGGSASRCQECGRVVIHRRN